MNSDILNTHTEEASGFEPLLDSLLEEAQVDEMTQRKSRISKILRWGGGGLLIIAAIVFMFQGMYSFSPMQRHWLMLAITGLLGFMGTFTGEFLRDDRGARVFFGFAAAAFPVLASQLGAMLFSLFGNPPAEMPQPLVYSFTSSSLVLAITCLTLVVAIPVSYLAFKVLARSQAALMTTVFSLANLVLLLPIRDIYSTSAIVALLAVALFFFDSNRLQKDFRLACFEGRMVRLILAIPLAIVVCRSFFYPVGPAYYGFIIALAGAYLTFFWGRTATRQSLRSVYQLIGLACLTTGWFLAIVPQIEGFYPHYSLAAYVLLLPVAILFVVQSFMAGCSGAAQFRFTAAIIVLLAVTIAHSLGATPVVSLLAIITAIAVIVLGTLTAEKFVIAAGGLTAAMGLGYFCWQSVQLHYHYGWAALAFLGIATMFAASLLETQRKLFFSWGSSLWGRLKK